MRCPYCGEDIKDDALLCKYCHQILLSLNKPLVEQNRELVTKITELQSNLANVRAQYEYLQSNLHRPEAAQRLAYWSVISIGWASDRAAVGARVGTTHATRGGFARRESCECYEP